MGQDAGHSVYGIRQVRMSARARVKVTEIIFGIPRVPTKMAVGHTQPHLQLIPRFV